MKSSHTEIGRLGERAAAYYLEKKGYQILFRNLRLKSGEVDIVARLSDTLVFAEVKAKTSIRYGYPEEMVDQRRIQRQENGFAELAARYPEIERLTLRFDVISILINETTRRAYIDHIEDYNN